ncbi:MAG: FHA domain-containing protein [Cocleimonas sp.]|nr:FHA domain-containing protein [Cocleimonas sp.]
MAEVVFETLFRGHRQYYKVTHFPFKIGRAFDNDIILSDPSISAHHLEIDQDNQGYILRNLSTENGTLFNKQAMKSLPITIALPTEVKLGNVKARVLSHDTPVEPTLIKQQPTGIFRFLNNPFWVASLLLLTLTLIFLDRYQAIPVAKGFIFYLNQSLPSLFIMLGIILMVSGVSRLITHRWEILSALGIASLFFLIPLVVEQLGHFLNYLLTSNTPSNISDIVTHFFVLPLLLMFYMNRVHLTPLLPALGIAVLVSSPISAYHISGEMDQLSNYSDFSPLPPYNRTLSAFDIRTQETLALDDYFNQANLFLNEQTQQMLSTARADSTEER